MSPVDAAPSAAFAPPCPRCKTPLAGIDLGLDSGAGACGSCATALEFTLFPASRRTREVRRARESLEGDACCYFHPANHAAAICENCGRYVCSVCEVPSEDQRTLCPPCVSAGRKKVRHKADEIVVYDQLSLSAAVLPLIMWPVTLVTAPIALGLIVYGWGKPRSLVRRNRWRFFVAGFFALLQIGGWVALGVNIWLEA
jgi:hypothetical protein